MSQVMQEISPTSQIDVTNYDASITTNAITNGVYYPESDGKPMAETDKHRKVINQIIEVLDSHFFSDKEVYVTGNIMFYFEEGNPYRVVAPDVMVVRDVAKRDRRVFKLWEEKTPSVIFEISSRGTFREDFNRKWAIYQKIGVKEYYVFDPEYNYLDQPFVAYRLQDGELNEVEIIGGRIFSEELNLEIVDTGETLRFFDSQTNEFLRTSQETIDALRQAELEVARLRAIIENAKSN